MEWSWGMSEYTECSKAHTDSTRFNKKIREKLCKFVAEKNTLIKVNGSTSQQVNE